MTVFIRRGGQVEVDDVLQKTIGSYIGIVYSDYSPCHIFPVYLILFVASNIFSSPSKLRSDHCRHSVV